MFRKFLVLGLLLLLILITSGSYAQLLIVNGFIINSLSGENLKEVSVFEKNSQIGTISNENGYFKLVLQSGEIDLSFSNDLFIPEIARLNLVSDTLITVQMNLLKLPKKIQQEQDSILEKQTAFDEFFKSMRRKNTPN